MKKVLLILALIQFILNGYAQKFYHTQSSESNVTSGEIKALEVDTENNTIVFGTFNGKLLLDDLIIEEDNPGNNYFIAKYNTEGKVVWVHTIGSNGYASTPHNHIGLALDASNNIYITASYKGSIRFDDGTTLTNSDVSAVSDFFVAKYNTSGDLQNAWIQDATDATAVDIDVDDSNNVYVAGSYGGTLNFLNLGLTLTSSGSQDAFIAKYSEAGVPQWGRTLGNADNSDFSFGVEVVSANIYWGMNYRSDISTDRRYYIYISKLSTDNSLMWSTYAYSTGYGTGYANEGLSLEVNGSTVLASGNFRGGIQFVGGTSAIATTLTQAVAIKITDNGGTRSNNWISGRGTSSFSYGYDILLNGSSIYMARYSNPHTFLDELSNDDGSIITTSACSTPNPNAFDYIYDMEMDGNGKLHFGGLFYKDLVYGDHKWTTVNSNMYLAQSDLSLNVDWLRGSYGHFFEYEKSVIDDEGNTYIGGHFTGIFKQGTEEIASEGDRDIIIEKYDRYGNFQFRKYAGTPFYDEFGDLETFENELYLTGVYDVAYPDPDPYLLKIDDQTLGGDEDKEVFLAKFNKDGEVHLLKRAASTEGDIYAHNIGLDSNGNIYLSGEALGGSPKNFGDGVALSFDDNGFFLSKYAPDGTTQWVQAVNQTRDQTMHVGENNNIIVSGTYSTSGVVFEGQTLPYSSAADFYIAEYDYDGNFQWVYAAGGSSTDVIQGLATDPEDNSVYATGYFYSNIVLPDQTHSGTLTQLLLIKLDKDGNVTWSRSGGGSRFDKAMDVALDTTRNIIVAGQYEGTDAFFEDYNPSGLGTNDIEALMLVYNPNGNLLEGHHWGFPTDFEEGDSDDYFKSIDIDANNDISLTGKFVGDVMLDTISVSYTDYRSTFSTKMSLNNCAYLGEVNFDHGTNLNAGSTISFADLTAFIGSTAEGWAWNFGDGQSSNQQNPTHIFGEAGSYEVTLTVTYNTSCELSISKNLSIGLPKTVSAGNDLTICEGEQASLSGNHGGGFASVQWNTAGDGVFSEADNTETLYTPGSADIANGFVKLILNGIDDIEPDKDSIFVTITPQFEVSDHSIEVIKIRTHQFDLDTLYNLPALVNANIVTSPQLGEASLISGILTYSTPFEASGHDLIEIELTNGCFTKTATFYFDVVQWEKYVQAGEDISICQGEEVSLIGTQGGGFTSVQWSTLGDGVFIETDNIETLYSPGAADISNGSVTLVLAGIDNSDPDSDTIQVSITREFNIQDLTYELLESSELVIDLDSLLNLADTFSIELTETPAIGTASLEDLVLTYSTPEAISGIDELVLELTNSCFMSQFTITFEVIGLERNVEVYNAVSPNGDGKHDFLKINNIERFPNNQLTIVNRNGQVVFEAQGYDNQSNVFEGKSNKGKTEELPDGSYFYLLKVNELDLKKSGHLLLKR